LQSNACAWQTGQGNNVTITRQRGARVQLPQQLKRSKRLPLSISRSITSGFGKASCPAAGQGDKDKEYRNDASVALQPAQWSKT
jgi:hypothetical protein